MPTDLGGRSESVRAVPRWLLVLAGLLLVVRVGIEGASALSAPEPYYPKAGSGPVRWRTIEEAERERLATGKPVLYDFSAEWCAPCMRMDREAFSDETIAAAINERFIPVRVTDRRLEEGRNAPEVDALLERYRVEAFPTLVVAEGGAEGRRLVGYPGKHAVREIVGVGP